MLRRLTQTIVSSSNKKLLSNSQTMRYFSTGMTSFNAKGVDENGIQTTTSMRASKEYENLLRQALWEYLQTEAEFDMDEEFGSGLSDQWNNESAMFKDEYDQQLFEEQQREAIKRGNPFNKDNTSVNSEPSEQASEQTVASIPLKPQREMLSITVSNEHDDMRLDRFLSKTLAINFGLLQKVIRKKQLLRNGKAVKEHNERVFNGDVIKIAREFIDVEKQKEIQMAREQNSTSTQSVMESDNELSSLFLGNLVYKKKDGKMKLELTEEQINQVRSWVLFKNDEIIALNKPYGICVQGGTNQQVHIDYLLDALTGLDGFNIRPKLVHRLDRDTTGVLIVARNRAGALRMQDWFNDTTVALKKCYWAITTGTPTPTTGRVKMILDTQKDETGFEKVIPLDAKTATSKISITEYKTIEHMTDQLALLALYPVTGRKHQLRVHCATALGCPILGDFKYGGGVPESIQHVIPDSSLQKLHLHHRAMILPYLDAKGKNIMVTAPLPTHFQQLMSYLMIDEKKGNKMLFK